MATYKYRVIEEWGRGSEGREIGGVVPDVAVDSQGRVYVTRRDPAAILVYDSGGRFLTVWGDDILTNPHSLWIDPADQIYCADVDDHTVRIFSTGGEVLQTLGTPDQIGTPGLPFNRPTKAMAAPSGEIFVSDGYGQHRVHRFSPDGERILSWGEEGTGPGQFALPHDLWVDRRNRVLVTDRTNHRIQLFDFDGNFLEAWTDIRSPNDIHIDADDIVYVAEAPHRISLFNLDGVLLSRWGDEGTAPGQFIDAPHGICVDSHGDIYITEVPWQPNRLQKFTRI
ncbi:MAG: peptidyl-alpha-hydroxyglycine alpha-amidating lyase family protein [bacterium]|nr:peptidyl-alpha-hydroxyglycine alpha-amidating lyase family protein [bacterium]